MMVVMTSWAPVKTLSAPGMKPQKAPPAMPARRASGRWMNAGSPSKLTPTATAATVPMMNCPEAPMLNRPARNATATERPVRISGVILRSVVDQPRALPKAPWKRPR